MGLLILVLVIGAGLGIFFALKWYLKSRIIKRILQGQGVFLTWNYQPQDWSVLVGDFPKLNIPNSAGKVTFTNQHIYLTNYKKDVLLEIARPLKDYGEGKHLTEVRRLKIPPAEFISFRVRTKRVIRDNKGRDTGEEKCTVDDFKISVPVQHQPEADKVFNFYQEMLDKNAAAVANVMPSSGGLGLFGG